MNADPAKPSLPPIEPASEVESAVVALEPPAAPPRKTGGASFVGAAKVVSILTFVSRITGLIRDRINSVNFGQAGVADALAYGFQVPNLFRRLFGEGALTAAFIPVYTELLKKDRQLAGRFASACLGLMALVLGGATLIVEIVLWFLWRSAAARGASDAELTLRLTMIMFPYMPLVCLVAMFGSILQVHGQFGPSAAQPILLNLVMGATMLWATHGVHGEAALRDVVPWVGWSVVVAGIWQCFTQGTAMLRCQKLTLNFAGSKPALGTMMLTFLPMLVALSVFQLNTFLDSNIALFLSPKEGGPERLHLLGWVVDYPIARGGVAAFTRSMLLYQFPLGVFGIAVATAIFPALAHAAAERQQDGLHHFRLILQHGLRLTMFIGLPASVGLLVARLPLCRTIFEGKAFTLDDSMLDASILAGFAPAIWAYSMTHVLTRGFYAVKDSRTPMKISMMMVALNLLLNVTLVWFLGVRALALSTAICAIVQCVILLRLMRRHVAHPVDAGVLASWGRTAILTAIMAAALWPITYFFDPAAMTRYQAAAEGALLVALGAAIFGGGAYLLGCEEIDWLRRRRAE